MMSLPAKLIFLFLFIVPMVNVGSSPKTSIVKDDVFLYANWRTIILTSPHDMVLPPPPSIKSKIEYYELEDIKRIQAFQRNYAVGSTIHDSSECIRWNRCALDLIRINRVDPPSAVRILSALSVAQNDVSIAACYNNILYKRRSPHSVDSAILISDRVDRHFSYPSIRVSIASASYRILSYFFPYFQRGLKRQLLDVEGKQIAVGRSFPSDVDYGDTLGHWIADGVLDRLRGDGYRASWLIHIPESDSTWTSTYCGHPTPLLPHFGDVKPWLITDLTAVQVGPPPSVHSDYYRSGLSGVSAISQSRTPAQLKIAEYWADTNGTFTPPGHWNEIADREFLKHCLPEIEIARDLALLNMSMMNACILCWQAKYHWWLLRPQQADTSITTVFRVPNFPSYTSGHAAFSGAAASVLSYIFPENKYEFLDMAHEAARSRVYGGVHYQFDSDSGLVQGQRAASIVLKWNHPNK